MKHYLLESIGICLLKEGYTVKTLARTCFDILARKGSTILLIKVLEDANAISQEYTEEMQRVSSYINGSPLIIAEKANTKLEDNVVYSRFGIYTLNPSTFKNCLHSKMPFVKSDHAGLTAHIAGDKLKDLREKQGLSINNLANKIGVSATMVKKYESGQTDVTITKALKIYGLFGHNVFEKINVFREFHAEYAHPKSDVGKKYEFLGFEAAETKKVPFDLISKKGDEVILTEVGDKTHPESASVSRLIEADHLVIFKKKRPKDIPAITKEEFLEFEKAQQLIKFLKEFE